MTNSIERILTSMLILALALFIDLAFGEPPDPIHPTVWMGRLISFLKSWAKGGSPKAEKAKGVLLGLATITAFTIPTHIILNVAWKVFGFWGYIVLAALTLKITFSLRGMSFYTMPIALALKEGKVEEAKKWLPFIVRRNPKDLTPSQIISAAVESIGESTVDGVASPLFYFAVFGVPGAVAFRTISTLDSMVGYRDREHINIGWFSASLDTLANYIPARLTALLMILSAAILGMDWRNSWRILKRDRDKTQSVNAGWPMAAMAGALRVQLEKPGFYKLGDDYNAKLTPIHIRQALKIMNITTLLFAGLIVTPLNIVLAYLFS